MSSGIEALVNREYAYGFVTDVETDTVPAGLNEDIIRTISAKKNEPEFMLEWRLKAYRRWLTMKEPHWGNVQYPAIDYNSLVYYSAPKSVKPLQSLDEVDPELLRTYEKLGISLNEQKMLAGVAVDAIFDSVSVGTTMSRPCSAAAASSSSARHWRIALSMDSELSLHLRKLSVRARSFG